MQVEGGTAKEFVVDNLTIYIEVVSKNLSNNQETSSVASLHVFSVHPALADWVPSQLKPVMVASSDQLYCKM